MTQIIQAIFEHGMFRPLEPVGLAEQERVSLVVSSATSESSLGSDQASSAEEIARQKAALAKLRREMNSIPNSAPRDGLGGADHDQILYGEKE